MANPRKPPALKIIAGTDRPDRGEPAAADLPLVSECPDPPKWLVNEHAVDEWRRLAPILTANNLLTEAGLTTLGHMCALHGNIAQLLAAGMQPTGHMSAQYRGLANDFGLTPVAQGKVRPSGDQKASANPFAENGKRAKPGK